MFPTLLSFKFMAFYLVFACVYIPYYINTTCSVHNVTCLYVNSYLLMHQLKTNIPMEQLDAFTSSVSVLGRFTKNGIKFATGRGWGGGGRSAMQQVRFSLAGCHQKQQTSETNIISLHGLKPASSEMIIAVIVCHGNG